MIEQQGTVIAVTAGMLSVKIGAVAGCPACDAGKGCGAGLFGRLLRRGPLILQVHDQIGASPGQSVVIGISESVFLQLMSRVYLLPLLAGFAGATLAYFLAETVPVNAGLTDTFTALGGVSAAGLALRFLRSGTQDFNRNLNPGMVAVVSVVPVDHGNSLPLASTPCDL